MDGADVIFTRYGRSDVRARLAADAALLDTVGEICAAEHAAMAEAALELGHADAEQRIARLLLRVAERLSARPSRAPVAARFRSSSRTSPIWSGSR